MLTPLFLMASRTVSLTVDLWLLLGGHEVWCPQEYQASGRHFLTCS